MIESIGRENSSYSCAYVALANYKRCTEQMTRNSILDIIYLLIHSICKYDTYYAFNVHGGYGNSLSTMHIWTIILIVVVR